MSISAPSIASSRISASGSMPLAMPSLARPSNSPDVEAIESKNSADSIRFRRYHCPLRPFTRPILLHRRVPRILRFSFSRLFWREQLQGLLLSHGVFLYCLDFLSCRIARGSSPSSGILHFRLTRLRGAVCLVLPLAANLMLAELSLTRRTTSPLSSAASTPCPRE
jgi:hypothetical protein